MIRRSLEMIRSECLPFGVESNQIERYKEYYDLQMKDCEHHYGYIQVAGYNLFVQQFKPSIYTKTVFLIHGYLDHAASLSKAIRKLVDNHYEVIVYDLPGHGLSSGERMSVNSFDDYFETAKGLYDFFFSHGGETPYLVAHSTGGAIALHLVRNKQARFSKMVLVAPLFRPYLWKTSTLGLFLTKPFIKNIKRVYSRNSSDEEYLAFTKLDPLQEKVLPLSWLYALGDWLKAELEEKQEDISFLMIQGSRDKTIDVAFGEKKVMSMYPNSQIVRMDEGSHQLFNEESVVRNQTFYVMLKYLKDQRR
ncbi:alpha/beta hydrolase [Alkalihalobacillus sp. MEB130]|uniref:alpha/beta hydrolase n=1 Tax=Alkalihalobacillus sp. MEB130 TaxID=2976704 RepID=UPI0028E08867|nr:alpha/beta fold hydrolase [Alkalihalobacillus sp. MEB130]MDT8860960.1 alpha/beta hydrolase [Alkalihalobacillus sp. MEB130]